MTFKKASRFFGPVNLFLFLLLFSLAGRAQSVAIASLPDAPGFEAKAAPDVASYSTSADDEDAGADQSSAVQTPQAAPAGASGQTPATAEHQDVQTKRILGIIPNFRSVTAGTVLPPQSTKEKFITATQDSFDYSALLVPAVLAGYSQLTNATPEFGTGGAAFGRYLWHSYVDQASENYWVEFIVPSIAHEDIRYYTLGSGGFWKRTGYALSRAVITKSDSGHSTFNAGEVIGAGAAAGTSNLYYPAGERTLGNTLQKWGLNVGIDAATFAAKEFWPDINHWLFHGKQ